MGRWEGGDGGWSQRHFWVRAMQVGGVGGLCKVFCGMDKVEEGFDGHWVE